jgi:hypothetical protein
MRHWSVDVCLPVAAALLVGSASAATFSTNAFSDAFVTPGSDGSLSANNYGGAGAIAISATGSTKGEFQSVMQYDLAAARAAFNALYGAGNWSVQSVTLQLTAQSPNNPVFNASAAGSLRVSWMQNDGWTEGTGSPSAPSATGINYNSLATLVSGSDQDLGLFSYSGATSGTFGGALTLSSGLLDDIQNGSLLSLRLSANDSTVSGVFNSRNFGTAANRPLLTIDVAPVPEPSTIVIAISLLGCCFGWRWVRRQR